MTRHLSSQCSAIDGAVCLHDRLVELLQSIDCKVNLIVFNTHAGSRFKPSTPSAVQQFRSIMIQVVLLLLQTPECCGRNMAFVLQAPCHV